MMNKFSLALLAALVGRVAGAPAPTCADQAGCVSFTYEKMTSSNCFEAGICVIEVCIIVDVTLSTCPKAGSSFSHMCDGSDASGCQYSTGVPTFDSGTFGTCPAEVGVDASGAGIASKCDGVSNIKMCQEGTPGQKVYFILKDGSASEDIDNTYSAGTLGDVCDPLVTCYNGVHDCSNDRQQMKERTFEVEVPDICDPSSTGICSGTIPPVTSEPTRAPTKQPTPSEETETLPPVTSEPTRAPTPTTSHGDPHFRTFKGEHFEYHGQCDLVLSNDPSFADGLGLDIQIRTKLVRFWSYVKQAAIRIGDDILEIEGSTDEFDQQINYWVNLEFQGGRNAYNAKKNDIIAHLSGFPVMLEVGSPVKHIYTIDLSSKYPGVKIVVATYKEFVRIDLQGANEAAFGNSIGMFGDFKTGQTLARDGKTVVNDFVDYGHEWQVMPSEPMLFHDVSDPQFPKRCIEPEDPRGERRRRLGETSITEEQAERACAHLKDAADRKDCVYDILATQDIEMVGAY